MPSYSKIIGSKSNHICHHSLSSERNIWVSLLCNIVLAPCLVSPLADPTHHWNNILTPFIWSTFFWHFFLCESINCFQIDSIFFFVGMFIFQIKMTKDNVYKATLLKSFACKVHTGCLITEGPTSKCYNKCIFLHKIVW